MLSGRLQSRGLPDGLVVLLGVLGLLWALGGLGWSIWSLSTDGWDWEVLLEALFCAAMAAVVALIVVDKKYGRAADA